MYLGTKLPWNTSRHPFRSLHKSRGRYATKTGNILCWVPMTKGILCYCKVLFLNQQIQKFVEARCNCELFFSPCWSNHSRSCWWKWCCFRWCDNCWHYWCWLSTWRRWDHPVCVGLVNNGWCVWICWTGQGKGLTKCNSTGCTVSWWPTIALLVVWKYWALRNTCGWCFWDQWCSSWSCRLKYRSTNFCKRNVMLKREISWC